MSKPATQQQFNFINVLLLERYVPEKLVASMRELWKMGALTETVADGFIQAMLQFKVNEEAVKLHNRLVGYHRFDDTVYRVYRSQNGNMYIKRLTFDEKGKAKMVYADSKLAMNLNHKTRMNDAAVLRIENLMKNKNQFL